MALINQEINESNQSSGTNNTKPAKSGWVLGGGGMLGAPINRSLGSEHLTALLEALAEEYKGVDASTKVDLIPIDNVNTPQLTYSVIVVAMYAASTQTATNTNPVAYHTLIMEATGTCLPPQQETINGASVTIRPLPSDALNEALRAIISNKIKSIYPNRTQYLYVDGTVVPASFDAKNRVMVHNLAVIAGAACGTELTIRQEGFEDLNLATAQIDRSLVMEVNFGQISIADEVGAPIRSDVSVKLIAQPFNDNRANTGQPQPRSQMNSGNDPSVLTELSAFVDVVYDPATLPQNGVYSAVQSSLTYLPRVVVTNLTAQNGLTQASFLLALSSAVAITANNNWMQSFLPSQTNSTGGKIDIRDVGALNILANVGQPRQQGMGFEQTFGPVLTDLNSIRDIGQLLGAVVSPAPILSIDVPVACPSTWYLSILTAIANGSKEAYVSLIKAADQLTNGNFSKRFKNGDPIIVAADKIPLGTWEDSKGNIRDIRDIDLLAVANLQGRNDPNAIMDWSDTVTCVDQYPQEQRLSSMMNIILAVTSMKANFTGYAYRYTLNPAFITAISSGNSAAGLSVKLKTQLSSNDFNTNRGNGRFLAAAAVNGGADFLNTGMSGVGRGNNMGGFSPRWS